MGNRDYFKLGEWNVICDQCGFKFKGSELRDRWDGAKVCRDCWEPRPPQEFVKGIKEDQSTPYSRPENVDIFTNTFAFPIDVWDAGASVWDTKNFPYDAEATWLN